MGFIRTFLAIIVIFHHAYGFVFVGGKNAVELFYILSGFLISYILVEKKAYPRVTDFYINRYLRIFPIYILTAVATLLWMILTLQNHREFFDLYSSIPLGGVVLLVISNTIIFFQDWIMFLSVLNDKIIVVANLAVSPSLTTGLLVPQAWTLGIELSFYLIAPFILTRKLVLMTLLVSTIALKLYFIHIGLDLNNFWNYRFFPCELAFFLLGALAHQVLMPFYKNIFTTHIKNVAKIVTLLTLTMCIFYFLVPFDESLKGLILFILFTLAVPFLFIFQNINRFDKWIGELSYPIYILHMLIIYIVGHFRGKLFGDISQFTFTCVCVVTAIIASIIANRLVTAPIEKLRRKYRKNITVIGLNNLKIQNELTKLEPLKTTS